MPSIIKASPPIFARERPDGDTVWYFVASYDDDTIGLRRLVFRAGDRSFRDYALARPNDWYKHHYRICTGVSGMSDAPGKTKNADRLASQIPDAEVALAIGHILRSKR